MVCVHGRLVITLVAAALLGLACGGEPETPEAQVRRTLAALEAASEAGDVGAFKEHVSERYADARGQDKKALGAYVTFHVMRNANRHVVLRVRNVLIVEPGKAEVVVVAGIAGSTPGENLAGFRGNVYQIDADFEDEGDGDWRLVWAQWKPTAPADLL